MKRIQDWKHLSTYGSLILFYLVFGLLLLLWPSACLRITSLCLAALLCIQGIRGVISYIRSTVWEAAMGMELALGMAALCVGMLMILFPQFLELLLPFLWGVSLLTGGFSKVQMAVDLKRIGEKRWWILMIASALSFVLGVFAITKPAFLAAALVQFVGISLLVEGVQDLVAVIIIRRKLRAFRKALDQAAQL